MLELGRDDADRAPEDARKDDGAEAREGAQRERLLDALCRCHAGESTRAAPAVRATAQGRRSLKPPQNRLRPTGAPRPR